MEILNAKLGWAAKGHGWADCQARSMLVIVDVKMPEAEDDLPLKAAFVVFDRDSGELRMPTYFRSQGLEPGAIEKLDIPVCLVSKVEKAARQFAERYSDNTGPGIPN